MAARQRPFRDNAKGGPSLGGSARVPEHVFPLIKAVIGQGGDALVGAGIDIDGRPTGHVAVVADYGLRQLGLLSQHPRDMVGEQKWRAVAVNRSRATERSARPIPREHVFKATDLGVLDSGQDAQRTVVAQIGPDPGAAAEWTICSLFCRFNGGTFQCAIAISGPPPAPSETPLLRGFVGKAKALPLPVQKLQPDATGQPLRRSAVEILRRNRRRWRAVVCAKNPGRWR